MDFRKYGDAYYIRFDRGDEIVRGILGICAAEGIASATFSGIGGCGTAEIQTFVPERGEYETDSLSGMLELVSVNGNVTQGGDGGLRQHTHALFAYKKDGRHFTVGGHLKSATVLITAEIKLRPLARGVITRAYDETAGVAVWNFGD